MVEVQCEMLQINLALSRLRFLHAVRCFCFFLTFKPSSEMQHLKDMNSVVTQPLSVEIFKVYGTNSCTYIYITEHQNITFSDIMGPVTRA